MKRRGKNFFGFAIKIFWVILLIISIFIVLGQKNAITGVEYTISMLEKKKMQLIKEGDYLRVEKARLASIDNIKKVASNQQGFHFPDRKMVKNIETVKEPEPRTATYSQQSNPR